MASVASDREPKPTGTSDLTREEKELLKKGSKLKRIARYTGNTLNVMLTVLTQASAGIPILRNISGATLAILETVQMMDDNHNLIALVLVDVVETSFVVALALESSDEGQEAIVDKKLSTYVVAFQGKLENIEVRLRKLLKPKGGLASLVTQVKGHRNQINDLHEELKKERANLHLLISALTYRGTVCRLPVDHSELKEYAGNLASSRLQAWQQWQRENPDGIPSGPAAVVNSQVGSLVAKKATKNAIGTQGTIYNGDNSNGTNTVYNIAPRGETKRNIRVGTIGNFHDGDVYGTVNQGCNTMYFSSDHQSQEPTTQAEWQRQQQQQQQQAEWQRQQQEEAERQRRQQEQAERQRQQQEQAEWQRQQQAEWHQQQWQHPHQTQAQWGY